MIYNRKSLNYKWGTAAASVVHVMKRARRSRRSARRTRPRTLSPSRVVTTYQRRNRGIS